jgi:hypothetical protein
MSYAYFLFVLLCGWVSYVADTCANLCRIAWFWAHGGSTRLHACEASTRPDGLCAYDCLGPDLRVFKTLTRGFDDPDLQAQRSEAERLRSRVLMVTMFLADGGMSCPKTQTFLHTRLKGFASAAPRASELARLSEAACGLPPRALKDDVVVIYDDFEERVFADDDIVVL